MGLDDFARDGQPETAATGAGARLVDLIEALEDPLGLLWRDVRARVVHAQHGRPGGARLAAAQVLAIL